MGAWSAGASVAINGTCLTVTDIADDTLSFDIIVETLRATNLGELEAGSAVNFERSARVGDEIGGHNVSGHIHTTAKACGARAIAELGLGMTASRAVCCNCEACARSARSEKDALWMACQACFRLIGGHAGDHSVPSCAAGCRHFGH
eukprot:354318-Chlamydomonas_euryale.AAC.17